MVGPLFFEDLGDREKFVLESELAKSAEDLASEVFLPGERPLEHEY